MDVLIAASLGIVTGKDHTVAHFCGDDLGPTLVVVGIIHGNEPSGSRALLECR